MAGKVQIRKSKDGALAACFIVPPFSILDTRQGYWMDRKRRWLALGIQSECGRADKLVFNRSAQGPCIYGLKNKMREEMRREPTWDEIEARAKADGLKMQQGTSIFDPVLCEIVYRWFCPPRGLVIDPFAGGSVRGVVAGKLGRNYVGVELRAVQVESNRRQASRIRMPCRPIWHCADSKNIAQIAPGAYDLLFTCPPYADLERYSDDPADLSTMDYVRFLETYSTILTSAASMLKPDCFAVIVVGEIRDKKGRFRGFISDTQAVMRRAGMDFYNEAILVNQVGSAAIRARGMFAAALKLAKVHQNVLVFVKGDPKKAAKTLGSVDISGGV